MPNETGTLMRAAPLSASSWNADEWSFELVLSAGSAVERADARGAYDEVLSLVGATWPDSIPMLDSHDRSSLNSQIGVVSNIRLAGGQIVGTAKLSKHAPMAQRLAAELAEGVKFGVSIGYRVSKWTEGKQGGRRTLTASAFSLIEASLVSIPADPAATTRTIPDMPETLTRAQQNAEVRSIAKAAGLDDNFVNAQIDADEINLDAVRAAAITAMQARTSTAATVRSTHNEQTLDNPDVRIRAAGEALYGRHNPGHQYSEPARQFVGQGTVDLARAALVNSGQAVAGLSVSAIIERALHSTSDFPLILGDSVGRTLRAGYAAAPSGLKRIARQTTSKDFKAKYRLQLSEAARLEKVNEAGEFKSGTLTEAKESYAIATYGKIFGITRQALINDDLGAFDAMARRMGQAAAATEAQLLADLWLANSGNGPTMSDTVALFNLSSHKNLQTAAAFDIAPLSIMRTAMRKQVGLSGELISVEPKFLLVPAELETTAEQKLRTMLYPSASTAATPDSMKSLEIVVEPRLTSATAYYLAADPASIDGLEFAYLEGAEGVQIETKAGFEVDGVQIKVRTDVGCGAVDWRAFQKNIGA